MMLVQMLCSPTVRIFLRDNPLRIANQIRHDVGVEQVTHYTLADLGGRSVIGGKSSFIGLRLARTESSDAWGLGSMMSRLPSFRITASSPGKSNSRGIRTA